MFGFQKIVEQVIKEAQERGEFDNLPGHGKPLNLLDDSGIPEDLRLAYKILKNADCLPPELEIKKEIRQMEDMLENIPDEKEKYRQIKRINYLILKLNMTRNSSPLLDEKEVYYGKMVDRLGHKK
ncbi:MAG: DnaJ family domain-containing protein [Pseudomonadota bacterium]